MKRAIVIVPTYNERENIQRVVTVLEKVFKKVAHWDMSILVVDDNSPDHTADIVRKIQSTEKNVTLLVNQNKNGLGGAYLKGMDKAFHELNADAVFEFDADLSHDAEKIPDFIQKIDDGYDMVLGSRYIPGGGIPENWGLHRKFYSVIGNIIIMCVLTDFKIRDWTGGYRAITKKVYEAVLPTLQSQRFLGYTFQIGFLYNAVQKGFKITEVPFHFVDRTHGESKMGTEYIKNILLFIFKARLKSIVAHRVFKFVMVGGISAMIQLITLVFWRKVFPYQVAFFVAIECAVFANFLMNNFWTFSDRRPPLKGYPAKFIQFNLASGGSIILQQIIALVGKNTIGLVVLFTLPILNFTVDTGLLYAVVGILIGMFLNFFSYTRLIWKK